jgi:hypothetical protein
VYQTLKRCIEVACVSNIEYSLHYIFCIKNT